ncbi:hypothetical protein BDGGKGIB_03060 [Nodularia sphaerocarpa UHCC 0038]|nr:hypothetical protein BDGGKGIB_01091 [Nodularia sphaerocarpa UHCC 0038]ULP73407.1 hypothetical protein BDGGKGIB_03060 [Nodularia sphaerocarpa UHCC 0038]
MIQRKLYKAKGIYAYLKKNKNITPTPPVEPSPLNSPNNLILTLI